MRGGEGVKEKMDKEERIEKEIKRIKKIFNKIPKKKKDLTQELIKRASFLLVMAEDMEDEINTLDGVLEITINGSQQFVKANPLFKEYRDTVKSYQSVIKQLTDLIKVDEAIPTQTVNPLVEFINK